MSVDRIVFCLFDGCSEVLLEIEFRSYGDALESLIVDRAREGVVLDVVDSVV
jgi:hypothetical protein